MSEYLFSPPAVASLPIRGRRERFAVNRIFCAGRNYHAHAAEMGSSVNKELDPPFYFTQAAPVPYTPPTLPTNRKVLQPGFSVF